MTNTLTEFKSKLGEIPQTFEDEVRSTVEKVLENTLPWKGYKEAGMIHDRELALITDYDKKPLETKKNLLKELGEEYAEFFLELLMKTENETPIKFFLTLIDQILIEKLAPVSLFLQLGNKKPKTLPFAPFVRILNKSEFEPFTHAKASTIFAKLLIATVDIPQEHLEFVCKWVSTQLRKTDEKSISVGITSLQIFLKHDSFRLAFADKHLNLLTPLLNPDSKNFQLLYQVVNCVWLVSFNKEIAAKISETKIIPNLAKILKNVPREKIIRMCLASFVNLLDKSNNNEQMIDGDVLRQCEVFAQKNWGDEDIAEDLETLIEILQKNLVVLSSFDMYKKEVMSGNLDWTPVHKSERFWKENALLFEEDKYKLLLMLKELLESESSLVKCVACWDLGEFARLHPRGRQILQQIKVKLPLMKLMEHPDAEVRRQALLSTQKLLVQHYEFLGQ